MTKSAQPGTGSPLPAVVAAAVQRANGEVHSLPPPARHHHVVHKLDDEGHPQQAGDQQGFLLSDGTFSTRTEAGELVLRNGQLGSLRWPPNLYSEDLW